jgi:hypothetical protein
MTLVLNAVPAGTTLYIPFTSYNAAGASVTLTGLAVTDVEIYKNGSTTQRSSDNGYALLDTDGIDFDGVTGLHGFSIDLSDNTDSGFYAVGSWYWVVVSTVTVDSQTVTFIAAVFRIVAAEATAGYPVITHKVGTGTGELNSSSGAVPVSDKTGFSLTNLTVASTVTLAAGTHNPQGGDAYARLGAPAGASVTADVAAVKVDTAAILDDTGTAGVVVASGSKTGYTLTATTGLGNQTADITGSLSGSVGSVTGNVGGNVTGSVGSLATQAKADVNAEVDAALVDIHLDHLVAVSSAVENGLADATSTVFKTDLTAVNDTYNDQLLVITSGALAGQCKPILDYAQTNGVITLAEALTAAPSDNVTFVILADHAHPVSQIQSGLATAAALATVDGIVNDILLDTAEIGTAGAGLTNINLPDQTMNITGNLSGSVGSVAAGGITASSVATGAIDADAIAADAGVEIAAAVWDRVLTGATHNVTNSAGRRLRQLASSSIRGGTAQAGASNSITLDSGASATNEIYDSNLIVIVGGTGEGQARVIVEYNGTTKVATVDRTWEVTPDNTSEFEMLADHQSDTAHHGLAQAGGATSITLASTASAVDDVYVGSHVFLSTSTGSGQTRLITAYNGTTKVATVSPAWVTNPTSASVYKIIPVGRAIVETLGTQAQTDARTALGLATANLDTQLADLPTNAELATALGTADDAVLAAIAALNNLSAAQVNAEVDTALADIHLDHLLAADYDPANKPGTATALLNELVENDGGVSRYTANALEQAPTGGSAPTAVQIRQEMDANSTQLAAIVEDTGTTLPATLATIATYVDTEVAAIKTKTDLIPADPADASDIAALIDALPTAAENAAAILAAGDVDGYTLEEAQKLMLSALTGILAGAATTTITIRAADNSKVRITATVDADGNRSALTLDATG